MIQQLIEHFQIFPVSSRDQLLRLYCNNDKRKIPRLNEKLLKLRDRGILDVNKEIKPYVYFSVPLRIKKRSAKLDHHLAIVNFWIKLVEAGKPPKILAYEYTFGSNLAHPDLVVSWGNKIYYIEIQRTIISDRKMEKKIQLYEDTFIEGKLKEPFMIWLITPKAYSISTSLPLKQTVMKF